MFQSFTGVVLASRYRVGARVGQGGTSEVYEGVDESLGRPIAIKILRTAAALARFEREARLLARLAHPNIVVMSDFRNADGEPPFIVMERLRGDSLGAILAREGKLSPRRVAKLAVQVLAALAAAHDEGVVHRDIKPDNVFVCRGEGDERIVKLLDFGIARPLEGATLEALTQSNALLGTVSFMAPEQVLGLAVEPRTDLYGLGATMYRALAGRAPFEGTTMEVLTAIATKSPAPLDGVDAPLAAIVQRAMQREPGARFASAREMRDALSAYLTARPSLRPPPRGGGLGPWLFASMLVVVAGVGAVALVARRMQTDASPTRVVTATRAAPSSSASASVAAAPSVVPPPAHPSASASSVHVVRPPAASVAHAPTNGPITTIDAILRARGDIAVAALQSDLEVDFDEYYRCYARAYASPPYPSGAVTLHFQVFTQVPQNSSIVSSDFASPSFEQCLRLATVRKVIRHASADQSSDVFYTLQFATAP